MYSFYIAVLVTAVLQGQYTVVRADCVCASCSCYFLCKYQLCLCVSVFATSAAWTKIVVVAVFVL